MTTKPEARLTSSLLARKGNAQPFSAVDIFSLPPQAAVTQNAGTDERATGGRPHYSWPPSPAKPSAVDSEPKDAGTALRPTPRKVSAHGSAKPVFKGADHGSIAEHRVALTLRVDQDRHMRLKLLSAKIRRSSQDIMLAALDAFLEQAGEDIEFCECLRPRSMCNAAEKSGHRHDS